MNYKEILKIWDIIVDHHKKYLADKGVKLPKLKIKNNYTKDALVLIMLAKDYPNTKIISKSELTLFIKQFYPDTNDVQQARHLSMQSGWNILSGTRGDSKVSWSHRYCTFTCYNIFDSFLDCNIP